jgi:thiamine transporter ThiT
VARERWSALAAAGLVSVTGWRSLAVAVALGQGARFVFHFFSGLIFFAEYAPAWEAPWLYAITYNLLYLLPSAVASALILWPLLSAYDAAFPDERRASG